MCIRSSVGLFFVDLVAPAGHCDPPVRQRKDRGSHETQRDPLEEAGSTGPDDERQDLRKGNKDHVEVRVDAERYDDRVEPPAAIGVDRPDEEVCGQRGEEGGHHVAASFLGIFHEQRVGREDRWGRDGDIESEEATSEGIQRCDGPEPARRRQQPHPGLAVAVEADPAA